MKSRAMILAILLALAVVVSACQPSVGEAKQQFYDSLNKLDTSWMTPQPGWML